MVQHTFQNSYKPGKHQSIDEGMITYKGRLSYVQYLPSKPIKRGIKVWMQCDAETSYLHQFDTYLGHQQHSANGLGYDVVMKLCQEILGKKHHIYFDNFFSSVPLMKDLLATDTYACGTVQKNKCDVPVVVK